MMTWQEADSQRFLDRGRLYTPRRDAIGRTIVDLIPAEPADAVTVVDIGAGQGWLSAIVLEHFPAARVLVLDGSPAMRAAAQDLLAPFGDRAEVRACDLF